MLQKNKNKNSIWLGRLLRYGPLLFWFGLIYYASTDRLSNDNTSRALSPFLNWLLFSPSEETIKTIHFIIRKSAHFIEYAILAFFLARALLSSTKPWLKNYWFIWSLSIITICSLFDEYHQSFESTRMASIFDCLIDFSGGLVVLLLFHWNRRHRKSIKESSLLQN